jgi:transposase
MEVRMAERGRPKQPLVLDPRDRAVLERLTSRPKTAQALALLARIVLGCAEGVTNGEVAQRLGVTRTTVGKRRRRFIEEGLDGLFDEDRPGAPRTVSDDMVERVVIKTLEE